MDRKYGVRVLASGIKPNTRLWTRKKVEEPSDVKGLKIRATGVPDAEAIRAFGGSPNFMSSAEIYEALLRGTIDGLTTYPGTVFARNLDEVVTFCIDFKPAFHTWGYQIYVLNKTFNSWPKEVQAIVLRAAAEYDDYNGEIWGKLLNETIFPRLKKKIKFITPTPEAMNKFEKLALPTYQIWVKTVDKEFGNKLIELSKAPLKH
jgi:TRAP-type C4-dicarboxylate transport system substrate-binding protein